MHKTAAEARPSTLITADEAGLFVPVFAVTARIGLLNRESDVAAELCEVVTAIGLALRSSPPTAPTELLHRGVAWAELVIDLVSTGAWTTEPAQLSTAEQYLSSAADLRADLDVIKVLLDAP